jgi:hypothetical protein
MKVSIPEVEAQRQRWARYGQRQRLDVETGEGFACGGLGRHVGTDLDLRLLFLPADPEADAIRLDIQTRGWLEKHRRGMPVLRGHRDTVTAEAIVFYDQRRDDHPWQGYVAIHRHGGLEAGLGGLKYPVREGQVFPLLTAVGVTWGLARLQSQVAEQWSFASPHELVLAVRKTRGVTSGHFADGWREPGWPLGDDQECLDEHVLVRWEFDGLPDPEVMAVCVGDRLEQAFGNTLRRHLDRGGEFEGRLNPSILGS